MGIILVMPGGLDHTSQERTRAKIKFITELIFEI